MGYDWQTVSLYVSGIFNTMDPSVILRNINKLPKNLLLAAMEVEQLLKENNFEAYLVGGCVRDLLLGRKVSDLDFTTNARPQQVISIFKRTIPVGIAFGTVIVVIKDFAFEVTTYRLDTEYEDGRRPKKVHFGITLEEDVKRRDFTINGLAYSICNKKLLDFSGGLQDLKKKTICTIGNAIDRFSEDGLRPVRGCRFAATLDFQINQETFEAIPKCIETVKKVAAERFFDEWKKTLRIPFRFMFLAYLSKAGLFLLFFRGFNNLEIKLKSKDEKTLSFLNTSNIKTLIEYFAAILICELDGSHNFDKPSLIEKEYNEFFKFQKLPLIVKRLGINIAISPLFNLFDTIGNMQAQLNNSNNQKLIKNCLAQVPPKERKYHIRVFSSYLLHIKSMPKLNVEKLKKKIYEVLRSKEAIYLNELAINGNDLLQQGFFGKEVGQLLEQILKLVHGDPQLNEKSQLLNKLRKIN